MDQWQDALLDYVAFMHAAETAASTLRVYLHYLSTFAEQCRVAPYNVRVDELARFLGRSGWSPATRKTARSALRSFYGWAALTGRVGDDPSTRLRPIRVPAGRPRPAPDSVLDRALRQAIPRDRLMVMLAAYAGLRRAEISRVHRRDVLDGFLRVHGKGGKERDVPLHPVLVDAFCRWPERGWIFPGLVDGHISADRVGHILAELLGEGWTGHTLRHRFLTRAYLAERDPRAVQELAGHAKLDTTMIYTKVPDGALLRAVMAAGPSAA